MTSLPVHAQKYKQLLIVIVAFLAMIAVSYTYVTRIVQEQIEINGREVINSSRATVRSLLSEVEVSLLSMAFSIESMLDGDESEDVLKARVYALADSFYATGHRYFAFNGVYGVADNIYVDSSRWTPPADYDPTLRPWYIGAVHNKGIVYYSRPFHSLRTNRTMISASRLLYDSNGNERGVLAINLGMSTVTEFIKKLQVAGAGYALLVNDDLEIIAHPDEKQIGKRFDKYGPRYEELAGALLRGEEVSAVRLTNYAGIECVVFMTLLPNGWMLGTFTPVNAYYDKIHTMTVALSCLGLLLMSVLCYLLIKLYSEKEVAYEHSESKSTFLARMSHEIRTPMNAIVGMSELILRDADILPPRTCSYARNIKQSSANLLSIINDILDFSKIESGHLELVESSYRFSSLLNDTLNIIRIRSQEKPILLVANIDPNIPNLLTGDTIRVRQVLLNLLTNAVKYTHEGFIALTIEGAMQPDKKVMLTISVEDSGVGISEENIEKLFDNFIRLDIAHNKGVEGTGLGLAITRSLCRMMGGDISVSSNYGAGSTFSVTIQQKYDDTTPFARVEAPQRKFVLVYEARQVYARSLAKALELLRVPHLVVSDQSSFFEIIQERKCSDIFLPVFLYESVKSTLERRHYDGTIALISQEVDAPVNGGIRSLLMPAHALSVANVLNKVMDAGYADEPELLQFTFPSARILVVDDIATNLSVVEGLLLPYNMHMDFCQSGLDAIALVKEHEYDIVFMDHMMPGMDGIEATAKIRSLPGERFQAMPIIALTANAVSGMREIFLENGMNDFLAKPIETAKLNAMLMRWVPTSKRMRRQDMAGAATAQIISIPGLDTKRGLAMSGGSLPAYLKTLSLFRADASERRDVLRSTLEEGDLSNYTICVHALKSASASIGSSVLSGLAASLESAARHEDTEFLHANTENFNQELGRLIRAIENALQRSDAGDTPPDDESIAFLSTRLHELREAMKNINAGRIDEILNELHRREWNAEIVNKLELIGHNILMFEYEEADALILTLLAEASGSLRA